MVDYPGVMHLFPVNLRVFLPASPSLLGQTALLVFFILGSAADIGGCFYLGACARKSPNAAAVKSEQGFPPDLDDLRNKLGQGRRTEEDRRDRGRR